VSGFQHTILATFCIYVAYSMGFFFGSRYSIRTVFTILVQMGIISDFDIKDTDDEDED